MKLGKLFEIDVVADEDEDDQEVEDEEDNDVDDGEGAEEVDTVPRLQAELDDDAKFTTSAAIIRDTVLCSHCPHPPILHQTSTKTTSTH